MQNIGLGPSTLQTATNHLLAYVGFLEQKEEDQTQKSIAADRACVLRRISRTFNEERKAQAVWLREEEADEDWQVGCLTPCQFRANVTQKNRCALLLSV